MNELTVEIEDFILRTLSVQCPECEVVFATQALTRTPAMTRDTAVEADLHRVLPHPSLRAALIAMCPACLYTWWFSSFVEDALFPLLAVAPVEINNAKKFAHAVLTGRKINAHPLDRALLALNGVWCAREAGEAADKWLELAGQELEAALSDESWTGNRSRYHYIMGEVCRMVGDFHGAVRHYNQVDRRSDLPKSLVEHQRQEAINGNASPVTLPPDYVDAIFFPKAINLDDILGPEPTQMATSS
ncbi:MAG: hypothetical protein IAF58_18905 [Leptolyngbya sp.]|nr:hypothetical protein [Candidatus Melainabacteria bacterium]